MRKPGNGDRPEWMQLVEDAVGERTVQRYLLQAYMAEEYRPLVKSAAAKRGMPVSHYTRRAVLAFVAYDLDIDFIELAEHEPPIPEGVGLTPRKMGGKGFGKWRIRRLDP